jgi:hypothetical protein
MPNASQRAKIAGCYLALADIPFLLQLLDLPKQILIRIENEFELLDELPKLS